VKIYISVVSHGHFNLIKELDCLVGLANSKNVQIYLLDNIAEKGFHTWCTNNSIIYLKNSDIKGFGENNNKIFSYIQKHENCNTTDKFLVLNPDVIISLSDLIELAKQANLANAKISTLNLFKDKEYSEFDNSVRRYPNFFDYMSSILLGKNPSIIDKSKITEPTKFDWAAGSFLLFDVEHFANLNGFDTNFYMYCEDIDICLRSDILMKEKVLYFPNIKAVHLAQHKSRSLFSKHLYWHLSSMCKYLWKRRKLNKIRSV